MKKKLMEIRRCVEILKCKLSLNGQQGICDLIKEQTHHYHTETNHHNYIPSQPQVSVTRSPGFDPLSSGESLWNDLKLDGELDPSDIPVTKTSEYPRCSLSHVQALQMT